MNKWKSQEDGRTKAQVFKESQHHKGLDKAMMKAIKKSEKPRISKAGVNHN